MKNATVTDMTTRQHEKTQFVRCNTMGHAWHDVDSSHWQTAWGTPFTVRCERCGAERRDKVDRDGNVRPGDRRYVYPPGYRYDRGTRPTRSDFRLMLLEQRIREARSARRRAK